MIDTKKLKKAYNDYTKAESSVKEKYCTFILCLCDIAQKEYNNLQNDKDSESLRKLLRTQVIPESSSQKQRVSEFCKIAKSLCTFDDDKVKAILSNNDKKTLLKAISNKNMVLDKNNVIVQKIKAQKRDHANVRKELSVNIKKEEEMTPESQLLNVYNLESRLFELVNRLTGLQSQYKVMDILKKTSDLLNKKIEKSKQEIKKAA